MCSNEFQNKIHTLLKIFKLRHIEKDKREQLYKIVLKLDRTQKQKERFISYFNLDTSKEYQKRTLMSIATLENCSPNAIRCSIMRIRYGLVNCNEEIKEQLDMLYNHIVSCK